MERKVCMLGRVVLLVLVVLVGGSLTGMAQDCGDVNGDGQLNISDVTSLLEYFRVGAPVAADSAHLEFDQRSGLTVADLASGIDCIMWLCNQFCFCGGELEYSYQQSATDTIFFPRLIGVPSDVDTVKLPIVATTPRVHCGYALNLPYLPVGPQSDAVFEPSNANYRSGDTALVLEVNTYYSGGRRILEDLKYVRTQAGAGAMVPEVVDSWDGKATAVTFQDTVTWHHDLAIPVIMSYDVQICCKGTVGNIDCSEDGMIDISDLTKIVNHMFITIEPLCCPAAANIDGDLEGNVDISDLTKLINSLFVTFEPLPPCLY